MGRIGTLLRHPVLCVLRAALVGGAGAWLAVMAFGAVTGDLGLVSVKASCRPALSGVTAVDVPPFGSILAQTHRAPVKLRLQVEQVHIEKTIRWFQEHGTPQAAAKLFQSKAESLARRVVQSFLLAAVLGAAVSSLLLTGRWRYKAVGTVVGILVVAVPLALTARTYDTDAFHDPRYEGEISRAPYLLDTAQQMWERYSNAVERLPQVADRVVTLYKQLERTASVQPEEEQSYRRVLAISDLHNNPLALRFALSLARSYRVDEVLVAGDVTDLGHPIEASLLGSWKEFHVPVVVVTGNHDSPSIAAALASIPGVTVLDNGAVAQHSGISVMGYGDLAAMRTSLDGISMTYAQQRELTRRIRQRLERGKTPDVLLVHNHRVARSLAGHVPVIVTGHSHIANLQRSWGSVIVNPGTIGAAGIRYLSERKKPAQTAAVLHFARGGSRPQLRMVDTIELRQSNGDFIISRKNLGEHPEGAAPRSR